MDPIRYDGEFAVFSTRQVDMYGPPDNYDKFYVVVEPDDRVEFGLDWKFEQGRSWRQVHRYSRIERFKTVLLDLVGGRKCVPPHVIETVKFWGIDAREKKMWNSARMILRAYGWKKYYNKIPSILACFGGTQDQITSLEIDRVMCKFRAISARFDEIKGTLGRTYFPDLRYIALKLLEEVGVEMSYAAVKLKTRRKLVEYESVYAQISR